MDTSDITYINNQLCIPAKWLYTRQQVSNNGRAMELPAIMEYHQYEYAVKARKIKTAGHPGPNKPAMVIYELLDEKIRHTISNVIGGNPYKLAKRNLIERVICPDGVAADFFFKHTFEDGRNIRPERQQEYLIHAWIFNAFTEILNNRKSMQFKGIGRKISEVWEAFSEALNELDKNIYPHKLPNNPIRLREKYDKYVKNGYISLIHGGHGNQSASKIKEDEQDALLLRLLSDGRNLDNVQISNLYNIVAKQLEWPQITAATVANVRARNEMLTTGGRRGVTDFRNTKTMQVKRRAPECALYYWTMDGWDVELLYQKTVIDEKGRSNTTYHNRLTLVVVLDTVVKYPIGYAIGTHETPELIKLALQNAMNHGAALFGKRYKPLQLQTDHYGKGKLTPLYTAITDKYTPARVKNAKSKVIEPFFNAFNRKYCQYAINWSGRGITSNKDKQPNSEMLTKNRSNFPDEVACRKQISAFVEMERAELKDKYMASYNKMQDSERKEMDLESYLYLFGNTTGYTNRLTPSGLNVKILGESKCYDSFDRQFRMLGSTDWHIIFDSENLEQVLAINNDGTRRFVLREKYIQPMALVERKEGDAAELAKISNYNNALEETVIEFNRRNAEISGKLMEDKRLEGTLTKLILTDSNGQHKNNRNVLKQKAEVLMARSEKKVKTEEVKVWADVQEEYLDERIDLRKYF